MVGYVVGCILTSALLLVWLRLWRLPVFSLVTANYFVAVSAALLWRPLVWEALAQLSLIGWLHLVALGVLFIAVFFLTGQAAQQMGVGLAGMLSKLSLVLPIGYSVLFKGEAFSILQAVGVGLALGAIVLVHLPYLAGGGMARLWQAMRLGLLLWAGNGVIDITFKSGQTYWTKIPSENIPPLIMGVAGALGLLIHGIRGAWHALIEARLWLGALILGLTNVASVIFYVKGLQVVPGVVFFLMLNLGIVLLSGFFGVVLFRERLTWAVVGGYLLGLLAIGLMGLS